MTGLSFDSGYAEHRIASATGLVVLPAELNGVEAYDRMFSGKARLRVVLKMG